MDINKNKHADRMKRLRQLHVKRNAASVDNRQAVIEEDKKKKLPSNWEARQRQAEWLKNDEQLRQQVEQKGEDYEQVKLLNIDANEAERLNRKRKRNNKDPGFSNYEEATFRQYQGLIKNIKPDMDEYEKQKNEMGEDFYGGMHVLPNTLRKDPKDKCDKLAAEIEKMKAKRDKFSRRRMYNDDADIDFINERNMRFNNKLERFYGEYTTEIKQSLERGTAI